MGGCRTIRSRQFRTDSAQIKNILSEVRIESDFPHVKEMGIKHEYRTKSAFRLQNKIRIESAYHFGAGLSTTKFLV